MNNIKKKRCWACGSLLVIGWYKHRQLRRSAIMVKKALNDMFHFIADKNIPKTTNGLDSYFGHLKLNMNVHRGLSKQHRQAFLLWYLHLKNESRF